MHGMAERTSKDITRGNNPRNKGKRCIYSTVGGLWSLVSTTWDTPSVGLARHAARAQADDGPGLGRQLPSSAHNSFCRPFPTTKSV